MAILNALRKHLAGISLLCFCAFAQAESVKENGTQEPMAVLVTMFRWEGLLASIVVIFIAWLVLKFFNRMISKLAEVFADRRLLFQKFSAFFHFAVYFATIVSVVLLSFKVSKEILVILSGTAAVALGFALKDLAASLMAGIMIMFDRPFQIGDRISFDDIYGDVIAIGLRSVKIQTLDDSTVTIPNNLFLSRHTVCGNSGVVDMQVVVDFYIAADQDLVAARQIIQEVAANTRFVYLPKPIKVIVAQKIIGNCLALHLRLKAYVLDTKFEKDFETDVTLHVMKLFAEQGIQPPTLLMREVATQPFMPENSDQTEAGQGGF